MMRSQQDFVYFTMSMTPLFLSIINAGFHEAMRLRIEMQIFSLHWMMQNIRLFNVCEARRASRRY